jgi:hypothetical protein
MFWGPFRKELNFSLFFNKRAFTPVCFVKCINADKAFKLSFYGFSLRPPLNIDPCVNWILNKSPKLLENEFVTSNLACPAPNLLHS